MANLVSKPRKVSCGAARARKWSSSAPRLGPGSAQPCRSNVTAEVLALEVDPVDCCVGASESFGQRRGGRGHDDHPAAGGEKPVALPLRVSVKELDARHARGIAQSRDRLAADAHARIACRAEDDSGADFGLHLERRKSLELPA